MEEKPIQPVNEEPTEEIIKTHNELENTFGSNYYIAIIGSGMDTDRLRRMVAKAKILANNLAVVGVKPDIFVFDSNKEYQDEILNASYRMNDNVANKDLINVANKELVRITAYSTIINQTPFAEHGIPTTIVRDTIVHGFSPFINGNSRAKRRAAKKQLKGRVRNKPFNR